MEGPTDCILDFVAVQGGHYGLWSYEVPILDAAKYEYRKQSSKRKFK